MSSGIRTLKPKSAIKEQRIPSGHLTGIQYLSEQNKDKPSRRIPTMCKKGLPRTRDKPFTLSVQRVSTNHELQHLLDSILLHAQKIDT